MSLGSISAFYAKLEKEKKSYLNKFIQVISNENNEIFHAFGTTKLLGISKETPASSILHQLSLTKGGPSRKKKRLLSQK